MPSFLLTEEVVAQAVDIVKVAFFDAASKGLTKQSSMHVVILDPVITPESGAKAGTVLYEESICTPDHVFITLARSKAQISWRYKMYSQMVQQLYPHLYEQGMTIWGGGVYLHGIAGGASADKYQLDQWFVEMVIITARALCIGTMRDIVDAKISYIGMPSK